MILEAVIAAVLSMAPATQVQQPVDWETHLIEQLTSEKITPQEYRALYAQVAQSAGNQQLPKQSPGDLVDWLVGAGAAILVLEVRLRKFLSTLLKGVLESARPFFKEVLEEVLNEQEKSK